MLLISSAAPGPDFALCVPSLTTAQYISPVQFLPAWDCSMVAVRAAVSLKLGNVSAGDAAA